MEKMDWGSLGYNEFLQRTPEAGIQVPLKVIDAENYPAGIPDSIQTGADVSVFIGSTFKSSNHALDGSVQSAGILMDSSGFYAGAASQSKSNANVRILSTGDAYFAGTITASTMTGGTIQTAASGNRVVMDSAGLRGIDTILGTTFNLPTNGDAPTFSSGVINETTFEISTNAVLRTSATALDGSASSAGVLINNTGVYAGNANQDTTNCNVRILATGSAYLSGNLQAGVGSVISGTYITANTITADRMNVSTLSAITADLGSITAGNITLNTSGYIRSSGKDNYADTTAGFFLGYDTDAYKLNIGNSTDSFKWTGSNIELSSSNASAITINSGGSIQINDGGDILLKSDLDNPAEIRFYNADDGNDTMSITYRTIFSHQAYMERNVATNSTGSEAFGTNSMIGQSFTGDGGIIYGASTLLTAISSLSGSIVAKIYAHTGTFGSTGTPTGDPLATSNSIPIELYPSREYSEIQFVFPSGSRLTTVNGTKYFLVIDVIDITGYATLGYQIDEDKNAAGNSATYKSGTWSSNSFYDLLFYIYDHEDYVNGATSITPSGNLWGGNQYQEPSLLCNMPLMIPEIRELNEGRGVLFPDRIILDTILERTATAGVTIDGLQIKDGMIVNPYKFRAYRNAAWTTATAWTKIALDTESYDTNSNFATGTYTIPVTGYYHFDGGIATAALTRVIAAIYKNGSLALQGTVYTTAATSQMSVVSGDLYLTAGDTIELWHLASAAVDGGTGASKVHMSGHLISL